MTREEFSKRAFEIAIEKGCEAAETYYAEREAFSVSADKGEIDRYSVAKKAGLNLRVKYKGKDGYAYTECIEEPEVLVLRAMDNAEAIGSTDDHPMQGKCEYREVEQGKGALDDYSEEEKIALALRLESETLKQDPRVMRVIHCMAATNKGCVEIRNTLGLDAKREFKSCYSYVIPAVTENGDVQTGFGFAMGKKADDVETCAKEGVETGLRLLGGRQVDSGVYRVILDRDAMGSLLSAISGIFSAEEANRGRSLFVGKEEQVVAADCFTLIDDPFNEAGPMAFDDEGTPSVTKAIIENGVFKTLLHNLKTAKRAGVASTGNGRRASASSPIDVDVTNLYIKPGELDFNGLVEKLGTGLIISELGGLHAGLNAISGEFSLISSGKYVENGKVAYPVTQVTVAGNFYQLLKDIESIGNDFRFGDSEVGSPSVLISKLTVAGK